ncbi:MAG: type II secretion system F family protein [Desulfobacterales bacterium]|jgi:general secretion pathway protein F/type IV pilus assembly protein PilC
MHYYKYKLITPSGDVQTGKSKLPYNDLMSVVYHLERDGGTALHVKKLGFLSSLATQIQNLRLQKRLSNAHQGELLSNIALMLRSGITLTDALEEAGGSLGRSDITDDLSTIISSIQGGLAFSEAAKKYPHIFPKPVLHLIRIGEETGRLDAMLKNAADHLKKVQAIINNTKQALIYPSLVLTVMTAGFIFWVYYVAPKILSLFEEMNITLPALTVGVMKVSYFFQDYLLYILAGLGMFIIIFYLLYRWHPRLRKAFDTLLLKLPVAGTIASASILAFITEYFSLLLNAGVDLLHSMTILKNSMRNAAFKDKLGEITESLVRGDGIAESFRGGDIFPTYVIRMINVGEMSGTLSEQLNHVAEEYRTRLSNLVAALGKMIEPVILVTAGILFAIIIMGLLLPVYDLASQVGGY